MEIFMKQHLKGFAIFAAYYLVLKVVLAPVANPVLASVSPKRADGTALVQL
jgi:hypothetical protein